MTEKAKRGRKKREFTPGEIELRKQVKREFLKALDDFPNVKAAAKALGISTASYYNYKNGDGGLPEYGVLKRAHDDLGMRFELLDFTSPPPPRERRDRRSSQGQMDLFLDSISQQDVEVRAVKRPKSETDALDVTVRIRFAG
jgi:transcriptional regulator with XRE-family HTH domain